MGFTKLDERILQSSIMAESATTFKVWIALLAACRENGIAYVSAVYLSSICHLSMSKVEDSLKKLEGPDEHSRSLADDGRRIRRVDGGYEVINYAVYRDFSLRDAEAERKRLYRQRVKGCPDNVPLCPDSSASASASASASEGKSEEKGIEEKFAEFWTAYPREGRLAKKESRIKFGALVKRGELAEFIKGFHGYLDFLKHQKIKKNFDQTPMYAKTFINGRWSEFVDFKYEPSL